MISPTRESGRPDGFNSAEDDIRAEELLVRRKQGFKTDDGYGKRRRENLPKLWILNQNGIYFNQSAISRCLSITPLG